MLTIQQADALAHKYYYTPYPLKGRPKDTENEDSAIDKCFTFHIELLIPCDIITCSAPQVSLYEYKGTGKGVIVSICRHCENIKQWKPQDLKEKHLQIINYKGGTL